MSENNEINVKKVNFQEFDKPTYKNNNKENIDILNTLPLEITVELGSTNKTIKEILELSIGSVIELNKSVNDPVNIFANGKLIATGEVVVIDDIFGIKITNINK